MLLCGLVYLNIAVIWVEHIFVVVIAVFCFVLFSATFTMLVNVANEITLFATADVL